MLGAAVALGAGRLRQPEPAAASALLSIACSTTRVAAFGAERAAETFTPLVGGKVSKIALRVQNPADESGDFVVQLLAADRITGFPTSKVLGSRRIKASSLTGVDNVPLEATFKRKRAPKIVVGTRYAVAVFRDGPDGISVRGQTGNPCPDNTLFVSDKPKGSFSLAGGTVDIDFEVWVGF